MKRLNLQNATAISSRDDSLTECSMKSRENWDSSKKVRKSRYPSLSRLAWLAMIAMLSGCGYHFAGSGDALPSSAETIYVQQFSNHTRQTGINDEFMRYVKDEIASHRRLHVLRTPPESHP